MSLWKANLALLVIALLWGSTFVLVQESIKHIPPVSFNAYRFLVAGLLLAALSPKMRNMKWEIWKAGGLIGVIMGAGYIFQTIGLLHTTTGKSAFVTGMYIIFVPLLGAFILKTKVTAQQTIGVGIAVIGMGLLCLKENFLLGVGEAWTVLAAICFAFQVILVTRYSVRHDSSGLTSAQLLSVALLCLAVGVPLERPAIVYPPIVWGSILFCAIFASALAFWLQMKYQRYTTVTQASLIMALESPTAVIIGWLVLDEVLSAKELIGCLLMLVGAAFVQVPLKRLFLNIPNPKKH